MNKLIYLPLDWLMQYDPGLCCDEYAHNRWFRLYSANMWPSMWPSHLNSRVHKLDTPWLLAPTLVPIPEIGNNPEARFDVAMDTIAERICKYLKESGKTPYVCWSGGIDSTSILVSLLKIADKEILEKLVVLYNQASVYENSFFFHYFIDGKIKAVDFDVDPFEITTSNYDKIVVLDGDTGNKIDGSPHINSLIINDRKELLFQSWRSIDYRDIVPLATDFMIELLTESTKYAPIPIDTVSDLLWWIEFNFKVDTELLVKMPWYIRNLSPEQSKLFFDKGLFRHYIQPEMQIWSMITKDTRHKNQIVKYYPKKYIYDFDNNDIWLVNKREQASNFKLKLDNRFGDTSIIALDQDWNKYYISDPATRAELGRILQRT
jgi:hypothetical protein